MIVIIIGFIITICSIYLVGYLNKEKPNYSFSFEDTLDVHKVPIVSFEHNGKTVNFIIDSGASQSLINTKSIKQFDYKLIENASSSVYGVDGNRVKAALAHVELTKEKHKFKEVFQIMSIPGLDNMNQKSDIEIHGILGSSFLKRYQFLINYKHLRATTNG